MKKTKKNTNEHLLGGARPNFIPLVFQHFEYWGQATEQFLDSLAKTYRDAKGNSNMAEFTNVWRKCLSVTIQKCTANVILRKISRLYKRTVIQENQFGSNFIQ